MKTLSSPSSIPAPAQVFIRPMLFAALGLHALFLFVPFPAEKQKPPENKEAPVKITQLPTTSIAATKKMPKVSLPKQAKPTLPKINRATVNPIAQPSPTQPKPIEATPEADTRKPAKSQQSNSANDSAASIADFPKYQPATPDCFEKGYGDQCLVATANLATVASFYQSVPKSKGWMVEPIENTAEAKIYSATKGNTRLFLHLFADTPTTVILVADQKIANLAALKGSVSPPAEYVELLGNVIPDGDRSDNPANTASAEQFAQPQFFYSILSEADLQQGTIPELRPGIDGTPKLGLGQPPAAFYSAILEADLKSIFQEVTKQGQYGGGDLYRLKKGSTTIYLNLVPTKDQRGTIVVTWLTDPTKS
jgi:hypothetical protein